MENYKRKRALRKLKEAQQSYVKYFAYPLGFSMFFLLYTIGQIIEAVLESRAWIGVGYIIYFSFILMLYGGAVYLLLMIRKSYQSIEGYINSLDQVTQSSLLLESYQRQNHFWKIYSGIMGIIGLFLTIAMGGSVIASFFE